MKDLFGDKVERATEILRMYQPKDKPYYGCFSGGKDSCVIKEIGRIAQIDVVWHYNVTTIDPPELVRFIKKFHPDVIFDIPRIPFFKMALKKGFPSQRSRWCCEVYKESKVPVGSIMIFGVRAVESARRAARWKEVSAHTRTQAYVISPIVHWQDSEVWEFIKSRNLPYCDLYNQGYKRIGCVGCPNSSNRKAELTRYPHFYRAWERLFFELWDKRHGSIQRNGRIWFGDRLFDGPAEMFHWYLSNDRFPESNECQGILDMYS
jgi:phosphoadenosine phosphosulfate reductase